MQTEENQTSFKGKSQEISSGRIFGFQDGGCSPQLFLNIRHFHIEATLRNTNLINLKSLIKHFNMLDIYTLKFTLVLANVLLNLL